MNVAVLGVGNVLMKDDGIGVHVVRRLLDDGLPPNVVAIDSGTSLDAAFSVDGSARVVVVDAARGGGPPGSVYRVRLSDVRRRHGPLSTCHDIDLLSVLSLDLSGASPKVTILGVEPSEIGWGLDLSPDLSKRLPEILDAVREEIQLGGADADHGTQAD